RAFHGEYLFHQLIGNTRTRRAIVRELAAVVLRQCSRVEVDRLDASSVADRCPGSAHSRYQLIHSVELLEGRPSGIASTPARSRHQPDGECLREILSRV